MDKSHGQSGDVTLLKMTILVTFLKVQTKYLTVATYRRKGWF